MSVEPLSFQISRLADELKHVEQRLGSEPAPELELLNEFRRAVDNVRLKAWGVAELLNSRYASEDPNAVFSFLSAERVRRLNQLVRSLCDDIQRGTVTLRPNGMHSLLDALDLLRERITQSTIPNGCRSQLIG
jgi:hypothetical protein